jgi:anti-sigma B factor antagonist
MDLCLRDTVDISILEVTERFDVFMAQYLNDWFSGHISPQASRLIINLATVKFIDSSGLASLIKGRNLCRQRQGDLYVCHLQDYVRLTFKETCLDKIFDIFGSEAEAIANFTRTSAQDGLPQPLSI